MFIYFSVLRLFCFFMQKTAYEMRISDWSSDVCSSDLLANAGEQFIRDLFGNDLILVSNSDDLNKAVGDKTASAPPVAFGTYSDRRDNEEEGWALQVANDVQPKNGIMFRTALEIGRA